MSLYNLICGMNRSADILLAVIGLKKNDIDRFRDVFASADGKTIEVYTRTGGGNREDYPNLIMRKRPGWNGSIDDDFDSTYCTDTFSVPDEWIEDVKGLADVFGNGLRKEFCQHLMLTLRREPTEDDKNASAYDAERTALAQTRHFMANGHTFVPQDDSAMESALKLAEDNGGKLRSCWGIAPLKLTVKQDFFPYPNGKGDFKKHFVRVEVGYDHKWDVDEVYWKHCEERFTKIYPISIAAIKKEIEKKREATR